MPLLLNRIAAALIMAFLLVLFACGISLFLFCVHTLFSRKKAAITQRILFPRKCRYPLRKIKPFFFSLLFLGEEMHADKFQFPCIKRESGKKSFPPPRLPSWLSEIPGRLWDQFPDFSRSVSWRLDQGVKEREREGTEESRRQDSCASVSPKWKESSHLSASKEGRKQTGCISTVTNLFIYLPSWQSTCLEFTQNVGQNVTRHTTHSHNWQNCISPPLSETASRRKNILAETSFEVLLK